jgi:proteasome lid subunit RPN8/RPN11
MPRIAQRLIDEMIAHSREDLPNEACGMVHAADGDAVEVHRVENTAASPYRYEMAPLGMLKLEQQRDATGETLFAIYHSHVASPAYPSQTDIRMAFFPPGEVDREPMFPDTLYILVSLQHAAAADGGPDVHAYHIRTGGEVEELPIEVV